jgi:hypothetical protein
MFDVVLDAFWTWSPLPSIILKFCFFLTDHLREVDLKKTRKKIQEKKKTKKATRIHPSTNTFANATPQQKNHHENPKKSSLFSILFFLADILQMKKHFFWDNFWTTSDLPIPN